MLRLEKRKSMIPQSSVSTNDPSMADSISIRSGSTTSRSGPIKSKIGSFNNITHKPGGGNVKIESKRKSFANVQVRSGGQAHCHGNESTQNQSKFYRITVTVAENKTFLQSRCGSLANTAHTPGGGKVKIESKR